MNYGNFWKSDWFVGATVSLLFISGSLIHPPLLQGFDNLVYDISARLNSHTADPRIVLIEADFDIGKAQPQQTLAAAIEKLSNGGSKVIAMDMLHGEPDPESAEPQDLFAQNTHMAGNVILPLYFEFGQHGKQSNILPPNYISNNSIKQIIRESADAAPFSAFLLHHPYHKLSEGAAGFGHFNLTPDSDGTVRSLPLAVEFSGKYYPSASLSLAAGATNIPLSDIRLNLGREIELGALNIAIDDRASIYPAFHTNNSGDTYSRYTLSKLLAEETPSSIFKDKIVLIGSPATNSSNSFNTATDSAMSRIEFIAHSLQSILNEESIIRPKWATHSELLLLLLAGLYLTLLLPRLSLAAGSSATLILTITLITIDYALLSGLQLWFQTGVISLMLLTGLIGFMIKKYLVIKEKQPTAASDPSETNKMLGLSFQSQGMLENAYEKFLTCPINDELLSILYDLGLAFERKRQFNEAINVYQHMASHDSSFRDIQTRIVSARSANDSLADKGSNAGISSLLAAGDNKPTLGRYEIVSELGKGAMGTVYLGRDPKINRQVAIKTLALSKEFEPDQLEEVKERFFHEAEIAGMLNHPNIVTIFDAGDEHDLAYIAMEYLDGIDLIPYTRKGKTLPISTILKIIAKVTEALQYAHNHGVIHRDIKPANIMILKNKSVKVTDFGIAHITESSKSKAGTVLGTPSYMSPEQLSGKPIDGRSDLFSLGVMLYEMVAGVRPFKAESISKLMFKIAKEPHADIRTHNPDTPDSVVELINLLLTKKADKRIGSARQVLDRIQLCLHEVNTHGGQS